MLKKNHKIPKFESDMEAAAFWDSHDSISYLAETEPAHLEFPKPRHKVVIDLGEKEWQTLKRIAHREKMSFNHLLGKFVTDRLAMSH